MFEFSSKNIQSVIGLKILTKEFILEEYFKLIIVSKQ